MTPQRFEMLSAYLDDALDEAERVECEVQLFQDPELREEYRAMRSLRGALVADPEPAPLPLRLDLALARQAEQFLAGEAQAGDAADAGEAVAAARRPLEAPTFWNAGRVRTSQAHPETPDRPWMQMAAAVGLALLAVIGMGIFAQRGGSVPTLSSVERRIYGLSEFGHEAMFVHVELSRHVPRAPVEPTAALERMLDKRLDFDVTLPSRHLGTPLDARAIELDGQNIAMADYAFGRVPVTMFAMPREIGIELFDIAFEPLRDVCAVPDFHRCYSDGRGTSLCVQTDGALTRMWVAHLPVGSLDKLVRKAQ